MAKLGLVTVLFNSNNVLEGFFKSIARQTFTDYHLYLIDNTSNEATDEILDILSVKYAVTNYTHIKNVNNEGVAKGNNQGIELSLKQGTTHTLLLNNDIEFDQPELLTEMMTYAEKRNEPVIIPKIYFYGSERIWMAGGKFLMLRGSAIHVGEGDDDGPRYSAEQYFNYAPTCFMLINNDVFKSVGLMDEKYFVYYDDTDFMYRACKKGYKVKLLPQLHVHHKVSSLTGGDESLFSIYYGIRNRIYFISKNFKGFYYAFAMLFTLTTRIVKYVRYDKKQKEKLLKGIKDGFELLK
jgi:GT2 family glycosyltransferase